MKISQHGNICHICNNVDTNFYKCSRSRNLLDLHESHRKCTHDLCKGYLNMESHLVCYKCMKYCGKCESTFCDVCENTCHTQKMCSICSKITCYTRQCFSCNKAACDQCINDYKYKESCTSCNKSYFNVKYTRRAFFECYDCTMLQRPSCDICNIKKCECNIKWRELKYDDLNITQLLKLCETCENDKNLLLKSKYFLLVYPQDNNISILQHSDVINNVMVLKTLLLIANTRNKYISKSCILYKIIPELIKCCIAKDVKTKTCETLYKCTFCLNCVTFTEINWKDSSSYSVRNCIKCKINFIDIKKMVSFLDTYIHINK